jgi:D-arabinose 5-phosphate isomerase GutQ
MEDSRQAHILELGRMAIVNEVETLQSVAASLDGSFCRCAELLCNCQGLIWVTAVGTSAAVGSRFAHLLTGCGARSVFLSPSEGLHGHTGVILTGDLFIALSRGGESHEVNEMARIANERGAATIALVHNTGSTLARTCQHVLPVRSKQEYELEGYLATTSTVAFSAMCDALCAVVLEAKGYTREQFGRIHPGGAVGQALGTGADIR